MQIDAKVITGQTEVLRRLQTVPEAQARPAIAPDVDAHVAILDALRHGRAVTRPDLVVRTGLGRGAVSKSVAELIDRGLVEEHGTGKSSGGRAPRLLRLRAEAGCVLAADVGVTSIAVAVADLAGRVLAHAEEPADVGAGPGVVLDRVDAMFRELPASGPLWGIGIGVPGPVEFATGRCTAPPIPSWDGVSVRDYLAERHRVPVWVDNEVNVMALGELQAGAAREVGTVVYAKLGTWIGGAMITDGRLHRGAEGSAGEIGHVRISDDPAVVCRCGRVGCLAALAGGAALARSGEELAGDGTSPPLAEVLERTGRVEATDVAWAASHGDQASRALIVENGRHVGHALAMVVNLFNPSLIVIGGGVSQAGDDLLAAIRESIYARSMPVATRNLVIQRSALGGLGGVIGAAGMATDEIFARHRVAEWLDAGGPAGRPELAAL
jgi:glucokinase-like ROK family protein